MKNPTPKTAHHPRRGAFSLVEVCVAIVTTVLFGLATFTTNQRLLVALKAQKETTAAMMALQWRMETLRATAFSNIANRDYIRNNVLRVRSAGLGDPSGNGTRVRPFDALGNVREQVTVSAYPPDGSDNIVVAWDAAHPEGQDISNNTTLADGDLVRVDVLLTWTSTNGRSRSRQISSLFTLGNIAP